MKTPDAQKETSRRQWLVAVGRWSALSLLTAISAVLAFRGRRAEGRCTQWNPCSQCGLATACQLPKATAFRRNREDS